MKPSFFIVGAAKSGTTSLANYLCQHPQVFIPSVKEPKYFSAQENIFPHTGPGDAIVDSRVVHSYEDYMELFKDSGDSIAGEASVDYLYFPSVAEKIKKKFPESHIFIVLRNPVNRAFSNYMHLVRDGRENLSFEAALEAEEERRGNNWEFFWMYKSLGLYAAQVERYQQTFGAERVHCFKFEDFKADPVALCQRIYSDLGVEASFEPDVTLRYNPSGQPRSKLIHRLISTDNPIKKVIKKMLPKETRQRIRHSVRKANFASVEPLPATIQHLRAYYRDDIIRLQESTGLDLNQWMQQPSS